MEQAALAGTLDFRQADPRDPIWVNRFYTILSALEEQQIAKFFHVQYERILAILAQSGFSDTVRRELTAESDRLIRRLMAIWFPWIPTDEKSQLETATSQDLRTLWTQAFGDPANPAVAQRIQQTADWLTRTSGV